jgi:hypothetical protein
LIEEDLLRIQPDEAAGVVFENRSAVDILVQEHRKHRKSHQVAIRMDWQRSSIFVHYAIVDVYC